MDADIEDSRSRLLLCLPRTICLSGKMVDIGLGYGILNRRVREDLPSASRHLS